MKKNLLTIIFSIWLWGYSQQNYWQQEVNYQIDVALNDQSHSLKGELNLEYINHSPDTLSYIWFHLWPNA